MYLAMNRFSVKLDSEEQWEEIWKRRESYLAEVPGFVQFMLLRGAEAGDYVSFSQWESAEAFHAWTQSESFRRAHAQGTVGEVLEGPPVLALYEAVIRETATTREFAESKPAPGRQGPRH